MMETPQNKNIAPTWRTSALELIAQALIAETENLSFSSTTLPGAARSVDFDALRSGPHSTLHVLPLEALWALLKRNVQVTQHCKPPPGPEPVIYVESSR
ncbi:MAG: hypothetical protein JWR14_2196 [Caballeronia sp.]|nr:hypothetical protein [Caballeronia sp.]